MAVDDKVLEAALIEKGLIDKKTLKSLVNHAKSQKASLEKTVLEREMISDDKIGPVIAEIYGVPYTKIADKTITDALLRIIPYTLASHQHVIPFEQTATTIKVALSQPTNYELINFIEKKTGLTVEANYSTQKEIKKALKVYHRDVNQKFTKLLKGALADPTKIESLKDAAKILDTIILFAFQNNASDVHLEPHKEFLVVRYRMDGLLHTITELPIEILDLLVTRIKVLSGLRTDLHRSAQDGRFKIELENNEITLRVSILPTYDGEKTVLRLLSSSNQELDLEALGYSGRNLKVIRGNILKSNGMILMTGPTGSGKTTTLYSILKLLNSPEVNISTIEDPVEYRLEGINQIQVNKKADLTFANGLRSLLRQDPDVIMVGEIRDEETASIAINAALTGHLVLATLHTNDVASTLPRFTEMGIEPFLVSATANLVIAQRLMRTICPKCKKAYEIGLDQLATLGEKFNFNEDFKKIFEALIAKDETLQKQSQSANKLIFYKGEGCANCENSGYKGRTSISEVMDVSDSIKKILLTNASPKDIELAAQEEGMETMFIEGMKKVLKGSTTIEEVLRVMRT